MLRDYHQPLDEQIVHSMATEGRWAEAFDALAQPLHEALYKAQDFAMKDELSAAERVILAFDYVQNQIGQGGFIQLAQNGYTALLVTVIEALQELGLAPQMASVLDDALKVIVLNHETLMKQASVEAFGKLYEEFREFELLEERFNTERDALLQEIIEYLLNK